MKIEDRLAQGVGKLRSRSERDELWERVFLFGGGVLLVGGFAAIVIGWFGTSHTALTFEQTPYLISGGLLGLGLIFTGAFSYFAYWLTRMVRETRESRDEATKAFKTMTEMAELLAAILREDEVNSTRLGDGRFVATLSGSMFHEPDCAVVAGRRDLRRVSGREPGMEPCRMCNPVLAPTVNA